MFDLLASVNDRLLIILTSHMICIFMTRFQRAKPIVIDPGLYQNKKTDIFWATQRRAVPTAFRLFTGAYCLYLKESFLFLKACKLLMY